MSVPHCHWIFKRLKHKILISVVAAGRSWLSLSVHLSFCSSTQWASRSQLHSMWADPWSTAWQARSPVNSLRPRRRWPRPHPPPPPPVLQDPLLPPRDLRPRLTARTVANLYVPGRTTASTCSSTPVTHISSSYTLIFCLFVFSIIYLLSGAFIGLNKELN